MTEMGVWRGSRHLLMASAFLIVGGCGFFDDDDVTPPGVPGIVPHGPDSALAETGIDADPDGDHILIFWTGVDDDDLAGYRVYRYTTFYRSSERDSITPDTLVLDRAATSGLADDTLVYLDRDVEIGCYYSYFVRSYDKTGNESSKSRSVEYRLLNKVSVNTLDAPRQDVSGWDRVFSVLDATLVHGGGNFYKLRLKVFDENVGRIIWCSPEFEAFGDKRIVFNSDSSAVMPLRSERYYQWRVDALGYDARSGSESNWVDFYIVD